jgi:predicted alpha/beta-fold hydrolase
LRRERLTLPDGDFIDIDWSADTPGPIVLVLHGLQGSARSHYVRSLVVAAQDRNWQAAVMHFRGCSGEPNRLARSYHSGETGDLAHVVDTLVQRHPGRPLGVVGYSLGGNALLKWLGETGAAAPVGAAVAVSVPFDLAKAADRMAAGLSRLYQWHLVGSLKRSLRRKFRELPAPVDFGDLRRLRTFRQFDQAVTAPLHGFAGAADYYERCSSRQFLPHIGKPTLIVHARDDPFMTADTAPSPDELSQLTRLELSRHGGHVGFVTGPPWRPRYWLDSRILDFLDDHFE